ncbi:MAG: hypothetical protein ACJ74Q_15480 [Pyrinomonadaceae bacterium]
MTDAASALAAFCFYLGIAEPSWLNFLTVPAFINRRRFQKLKRKFPRAVSRWGLDSGGYTEIEMFGEWRMSAREYIALVRFLREVVGNLDFALAMDWPVTLVTNKITRLSIKAHQARTLVSYVELVDLAPDLEAIFTPVLVGYEPHDFIEMASSYYSVGVDLEKLPRVALGGLASRQHLPEVADLVSYFARCKIPIHGLGFKKAGLSMCASKLASADSQSWSQEARLEALDGTRRPTPSCAHTTHCGNCLHRAIEYRDEILNVLPRSIDYDSQAGLFSVTSEPHYLDLYQGWGLARDRAVPLSGREAAFAKRLGLAKAA